MIGISKDLQSLLSVLGVCICVGVPLWWKTTEVYRCPLPYNEIEQLSDLSIPPMITYTIRIVNLLECNKDPLNTQQLEQILKERVGKGEVISELVYHVDIVRPDETQRKVILSQLQKDPFRVPDDAFNSSVGIYSIYLVPGGSLPCNNDNYQTGVFYSHQRHVVIEYQKDIKLYTRVMEAVRQLSGHVVVNSTVMRTLRDRQAQFDMDGLRQLRSSEGYQVTMTLLIPDPAELDCTWNVENATNSILLPFLSSKGISRLGKFTISSQVFYYSNTNLRSKWSKKDASYIVTVDQLPPLISSLEAKLGSHVSQWPGLNFVVYVPRLTEIPLHIKEKKDSSSPPADSFLVPQWGGVAVFNHNGSRAVKHRVGPLMVDMESVMPLFVQHLKLLLGLPSVDERLNHEQCLKHYPTIDPSISADWLEDQLLVVKMVESASTAVGSLVSLVQLLDKVKNMVIGDHIQSQVEKALHELITSYSLAENGDLEAAYTHAKSAMLNAENAFYDPSILALLYFPDDQKFAIYIPLFLPIGIPMLINILKRLKKKKNEIQQPPRTKTD